jgi:YidC/Oxa1 family membrane protein insertase
MSLLYTLIIFPIEQIIEICFFYGQTWFRSHGVAIIGVSIAVSTLILPVYLMAEKQQQKQRGIEKSLKKGVDVIKSVFKGDERFMLLSTYYRQNNYRPVFALRNSIDLLIQIPFFIAAYHFLSNLEILKGEPFWFITDLGNPDKLLWGFNFLPIIMTVINLASVMIYSKDLEAKDKAQLYIMAGIFLVLLYNSPAGLVLYWTSNNLYSLIKNIIQKVYKDKNIKALIAPKPIRTCLVSPYPFERKSKVGSRKSQKSEDLGLKTPYTPEKTDTKQALRRCGPFGVPTKTKEILWRRTGAWVGIITVKKIKKNREGMPYHTPYGTFQLQHPMKTHEDALPH